jgi:hypothetical protein
LAAAIALFIATLSSAALAQDDEGELSAWSLRSYIPGELSGFLAVDSRVFFQDEQYPGQDRNSGIFSLVTQPEWYYPWNDGDDSVLFVPFFRYDSVDSRRTHFDIRELYYLHLGSGWEVRAGIGKVFWGVIESQHLVDIINQTDFVEDIDREDKLGQPMVQGTLIRDLGTFELFLMSGFRNRTFPGRRGRLRAPIIIAQDDPKFESDLGHGHIDVAGRWSRTFGDFELALSNFYGTSRDPRLEPVVRNGNLKLIPHYDLINQTGIEGQYTGANLLLKLEAIGRDGLGPYRGAFATGFEYTFVGVFDTAADLGVLGEFHYDSANREDRSVAFNPFEHDIFTGIRLALNDEQSSDLLTGVIVDVTDGGQFWTAEASRRLWSNWRLEFEMRLFQDIPPSNFASVFAKDDFVQGRLAWYF